MQRLIDTAQTRLRRAEEGKDSYRDNDVFVIGKGETGPLFRLDLSIAHSTVKPQKLLKNDGSVVMQIVESVRLAGTVSRRSVGLVRRRRQTFNAPIFLIVEGNPSQDGLRVRYVLK